MPCSHFSEELCNIHTYVLYVCLNGNHLNEVQVMESFNLRMYSVNFIGG